MDGGSLKHGQVLLASMFGIVLQADAWVHRTSATKMEQKSSGAAQKQVQIDCFVQGQLGVQWHRLGMPRCAINPGQTPTFGFSLLFE